MPSEMDGSAYDTHYLLSCISYLERWMNMNDDDDDDDDDDYLYKMTQTP